MKPEPSPTTDEDCADLIVHLARLAHSGPGAAQLSAAQWTALRYFARANRFSRTPSAFSEFHATTRGTASQTVKSLVSMGFLERRSNEADGRSALIEVTDAGHAMLAQDPLADLRRALAEQPAEVRAALMTHLRAATETLAERRSARTFGRCDECSHCAPRDTGAYCHCTQAMLRAEEMGALCIDFTPKLRSTG